MERLQQSYRKIGEEIISKAWDLCKRDLEKATIILTFIAENTLNSKTTILKIWRNCNEIYVDTQEKLREICATSNLHGFQGENELKIIREMCLHILWNILKYPKHIKYRQIHKQALYNYLFQKCHTLGADFEQVLIGIEADLQKIGFKKKKDNNWYYQYHHIQLLHLWRFYQSVINLQPMYFYMCLYCYC
ncbi:hypothetical protein RFI_03650 [Reticulomyxa filosa]|uniref:Uncharacterized protein n=1 Tax=Reticulomyxa filosa TaxID=46433 RepID=X6P749_RETFI|nr:hypothetical protein RFI_03650 [Reticulomyxa filosa]|eukprot:ETO33457.1 hypothetical protein RFI_03650 [Reticulomyxa filosa]